MNSAGVSARPQETDRPVLRPRLHLRHRVAASSGSPLLTLLLQGLERLPKLSHLLWHLLRPGGARISRRLPLLRHPRRAATCVTRSERRRAVSMLRATWRAHPPLPAPRRPLRQGLAASPRREPCRRSHCRRAPSPPREPPLSGNSTLTLPPNGSIVKSEAGGSQLPGPFLRKVKP